jgi:hypothetical protein
MTAYDPVPMDRERTAVSTAEAYGPGDPTTGIWGGFWRDRVRWGPIWAGLITAIALFLVLTTIAVAVGAQTVATGSDAEGAGTAGGIVTGVLALVAFLIGGFVASRTAPVIGRGYGALHGFLVWALGLIVILGVAAFGLGSLFGASGELFAQYRSLGSPQPEGVDPQQVAEGIRNSSLGALVGLLLPATAATVGGWLAGRDVARVETDE